MTDLLLEKSFDRRPANERSHASGHGSTSRHRAYGLLFTFAILAAVFAAIIALRVAAFLPNFPN